MRGETRHAICRCIASDRKKACHTAEGSGCGRSQGKREKIDVVRGEQLLDDAQHDRADEGKREIRGYNAHAADESHGSAPLVHAVGSL